MEKFDAHKEAQSVMALYRKFLKEHNTTSQTVTANILWLWPKYLKNNHTIIGRVKC